MRSLIKTTGLALFAMILSVSARAQNVEVGSGIYCDSQKQVERFIALFHGDAEATINTVNAEEPDGLHRRHRRLHPRTRSRHRQDLAHDVSHRSGLRDRHPHRGRRAVDHPERDLLDRAHRGARRLVQGIRDAIRPQELSSPRTRTAPTGDQERVIIVRRARAPCRSYGAARRFPAQRRISGTQWRR
jgi:hypothetical protein